MFQKSMECFAAKRLNESDNIKKIGIIKNEKA
jgi:hypothetical protein